MDEELARYLGIECVPLPHPIPAHVLDGHLHISIGQPGLLGCGQPTVRELLAVKLA